MGGATTALYGIFNPTSGGGGGLPTHSLLFTSSSSQYLSMGDSDFGAYDRAKWAISLWFRNVSATDGAFMNHNLQQSGNRGFAASLDGGKINVEGSQNGTSFNFRQQTTTSTYNTTGVWYHLLIWFDSANVTAGDRQRMWVNGSEITSFATDTNPTAPVYDTTGNMDIGRYFGTTYFNGYIYQLGFFSGTLPSIGDVYDSGNPKDISGLSGLYSYLDCAGGSAISDGVLATDWTNNNTVSTTTTIP